MAFDHPLSPHSIIRFASLSPHSLSTIITIINSLVTSNNLRTIEGGGGRCFWGLQRSRRTEKKGSSV